MDVAVAATCGAISENLGPRDRAERLANVRETIDF
jgi:hypothetical protein